MGCIPALRAQGAALPLAEGERTPVWLMRQAGRYMKVFRDYSDKYPFRQASLTMGPRPCLGGLGSGEAT